MGKQWMLRGVGFLLVFGLLCLSEAMERSAPSSQAAIPMIRVGWLALIALLVIGVNDFLGRRGARRFRALSEISKQIGACADLDLVLQTSLDTALQITDGQGGVLFVEDGDENFRCRAVFGLDDCLVGELLPADQASQAFSSLSEAGTVVLYPSHVSGDLIRIDHMDSFGTVVAVPLVADSGRIGLMLVGYKRARDFLRSDLEALGAIASQVALAVVNRRLYDQLMKEARTDSLTGVGSRRFFEDQYRREIARAQRYQRPLSLALVDLDNFKHVNDDHGHQVGDAVLSEIGAILQRSRAGDIPARYGGDEFVVLMPDTNLDGARMAVRRIEAELEMLNQSGRFPFLVRLSVGVAEWMGDGVDLLGAADARMYRDKQIHHGELGGSPGRATAPAAALVAA